MNKKKKQKSELSRKEGVFCVLFIFGIVFIEPFVDWLTTLIFG